MIRRHALSGVAALSFAATSAQAQGVPKEMSWNAYDTGWLSPVKASRAVIRP